MVKLSEDKQASLLAENLQSVSAQKKFTKENLASMG